MSRLLVLLLVLCNLGYLAWSQGWLRAYGLAPAVSAEPGRLQQQIRPEAVNILSREEARQAEEVARQRQCLQAGPFAESQVPLLLKALEGWPTGSWRIEAVNLPVRWLVYMGRYTDAAALARKQDELRAMGLSNELPAHAEMMPGLVLGAFESQAQAQEALAALNRRGVRTARVVQEPSSGRGTRLVLPQMDDVLHARLDALKPALAGRTPKPCDP